MKLLEYPLSKASLNSKYNIRNYSEVCLTVDHTKRLEIKKYYDTYNNIVQIFGKGFVHVLIQNRNASKWLFI